MENISAPSPMPGIAGQQAAESIDKATEFFNERATKTNPEKKKKTFLMVFQEFPVKNSLPSISLEMTDWNASKK